MHLKLTGLVALLLAVAAAACADDWPQWLGPQGDGIWREAGIVEQVPDDGLPVVWRADIGLGYSGPAVAKGRLYVMDYQLESGKITNNPGGHDKLTGRERVLCLDATTGATIWTHEYERPYLVSYGGGPRCTPTVVDGKVYALGAEGNLWCLDASDGSVIWSVDYRKDFGAETPMWGVAAHPLVDGQQVYCVVGGEGSVAVALDKDTGKELWRALSAREPGYCPPTIIEHGGARQLLIWHAESLNSLNPKTGEVYWTAPLVPAFGMAIAARKSGSYLLASAYKEVALLKLDDDKPALEDIVWRSKTKVGIFSANVTPIIEEGTIYGCDIETGALMGVNLKDGERLWQTAGPTFGGPRSARYGTAFLVKNGGQFVLFSEQGDVILAKLTRQGYEETGRSRILEPTNSIFGRKVIWSHPAFANRCVYARNDKEIICVSLAAD